MRLAHLLCLMVPFAVLGGCATTGGIQVLGASSLDVPLRDVAADYETSIGDAVRVSTGGSSTLVEQAIQGAPFDVLIVADAEQTERASEAGIISDTRRIATNHLEIAVPQDNPAGLKTWRDVAHAERLVVCAPQVPCGHSARIFAQRAGLELHPVSEELSVREVLAKVASADADAGLVFHSDIVTSPQVRGVVIPKELTVTNTYHVLLPTDPSADAVAFADFLQQDEAQRYLREAGFESP